MSNLLPHPSSDALTIQEVVSWQLHWLFCDLEFLDLSRTRNESVSNVVKNLYTKIEKVDQIRKRYEKIRWEVATMLGTSTTQDVNSFFASIPKHLHLKALLEKKETELKLEASQILKTMSSQLNTQIENGFDQNSVIMELKLFT